MIKNTSYNRQNTNNGITLIALIITIIVMLILVSVTISMAINGGLFKNAGDAVGDTQNAINAEQELANGEIRIDGVTYDSINEFLYGEERKLDVEYTQSEGENLWSSTVTFNITLDEEIEYTLDQKRNIVAYMIDYSSYEEFKEGLIEIFKSVTEITITYDEFIDSYGGEEEFLNLIIEAGGSIISYRDIEKLERLGIKVITVETPYGTTLYTSSIGKELACTFCKNGEYTFIIKSGATQLKETVKIDNIRTSSPKTPYTVNLVGGTGIGYISDEESTILTGENIFESSKQFTVYTGYNEEKYSPRLQYVILNENFYKYFSSTQEWDMWMGDYYRLPSFYACFSAYLRTYIKAVFTLGNV